MDENSAQNLPISDLSPLAQAASEFASYPGSFISPAISSFPYQTFIALFSSVHVPILGFWKASNSFFLFPSFSSLTVQRPLSRSRVLPGMQTDASVKEFLDRFPLPVIFRYFFKSLSFLELSFFILISTCIHFYLGHASCLCAKTLSSTVTAASAITSENEIRRKC